MHRVFTEDFPAVPITSGLVLQTSFQLHSVFRISRGARTEAHVVEVALRDDEDRVGRGECTPYPRYGESLDGVADTVRATIESLRGTECTPRTLLDLLPAGAARNGLDAALWDLTCKRTGQRAWELAKLPPPPERIRSVDTVVLDEPDAMREAARARAARPILKVKLDADRVVERITAVREGAPEARLVVDANEAWSRELLDEVCEPLAEAGVEMIEQPLPAGNDADLDGFAGPVVLCADESCHTRADLERLVGRYGMVNVKLDKTGGPTEGLALAWEARSRGFELMVGCMVSSSLGIAPAWMVAAQGARFVDLDGPAWLKQDRPGGMVRDGLWIAPPPAALWG